MVQKNRFLFMMLCLPVLVAYNNCSSSTEASLDTTTSEQASIDGGNNSSPVQSKGPYAYSTEVLSTEKLETSQAVLERYVIDDYDSDGIKDILVNQQKYSLTDRSYSIVSGKTGLVIKRFYMGTPYLNTPPLINDKLALGEDIFTIEDANDNLQLFSFTNESFLPLISADGLMNNTVQAIGDFKQSGGLCLSLLIYTADDTNSASYNKFQIYDDSGNLVSEIYPNDISQSGNGYKIGQVAVLGDINGDGSTEFGFTIYDSNNTNGEYYLVDVKNNKVLKQISDYINSSNIKSISDRNGDGVRDVVHFYTSTAVKIYDGKTFETIESYNIAGTKTGVSSTSIDRGIFEIGDIDNGGKNDFLFKATLPNVLSSTLGTKVYSIILSGENFEVSGIIKDLGTSGEELQDVDGDGIKEVYLNGQVLKIIKN